MGKFFKELSDDLAAWALKQPLFFVASAPLVGNHINSSPKGLLSASFSILSPRQYIDSTGSGCETISHIYENGRVTVMFLSFGPSPRIMRLFCTGTVYESDSPEFEGYVSRIGTGEGLSAARAVIVLDVFKVQTSCGFGVPVVNEKGEFVDRNTIDTWGRKKKESGTLGEYQAAWNSKSLDGCPGLKLARRNAGEKVLLFGDTKALVRRVAGCWDVLLVGLLVGILVAAGLQATVGLDMGKALVGPAGERFAQLKDMLFLYFVATS